MQCVSSSEPDFVPPSMAEGAQSPSEATEMFEQGGKLREWYYLSLVFCKPFTANITISQIKNHAIQISV